MGTLIQITYLRVMTHGWLIVARALLPWFPMRPGNPVFATKRALDVVTETYLRLFRRLLPAARIGSAGLNPSALVGLVVFFVVMQVLARI
jgi:uncharacterized protein YggT (Ycf19 family)